MDFDAINTAPEDAAEKALLQCCGSKRWAHAMVQARPFQNVDTLIAKANDVWWSLEAEDWREAFRSHPKIGEKEAAAPVSHQSSQWSGQEQAGVSNASQQTIDDLAALNRAYEQQFGFIFIICATGKTSEEMLAALQKRLDNDLATELPAAAAEQSKITELRLKKLISWR